jgi:hypothetical protein
MKNPIQAFEPKTNGRDFVIGDLHGSFTALEKLLEGLNFNPLKDRIFSVGDLVDRGPDSQRCLELLYEPWFHAVLSNHEQMMLQAFNGGKMGYYWLQNGGFWGQKALSDWKKRHLQPPAGSSLELFEMLDLVNELPFLITVQLKSGRKIHVIHAELPPDQIITDTDLVDPQKVVQYAQIQDRNGDWFLWSRFIYCDFYRANLADEDKIKRIVANRCARGIPIFNDQLSHIVSGHTIVQRPLTILGQTNIDTCAYGCYDDDKSRWEALTCVELDTWRFFQSTPVAFREVKPLEITWKDV